MLPKKIWIALAGDISAAPQSEIRVCWLSPNKNYDNSTLMCQIFSVWWHHWKLSTLSTQFLSFFSLAGHSRAIVMQILNSLLSRIISIIPVVRGDHLLRISVHLRRQFAKYSIYNYIKLPKNENTTHHQCYCWLWVRFKRVGWTGRNRKWINHEISSIFNWVSSFCFVLYAFIAQIKRIILGNRTCSNNFFNFLKI